MFPLFIITISYSAHGRTVICRDVHEGVQAYQDALEAFDDENDVSEVIRLDEDGTWSAVTGEAHQIIREAQIDAATTAQHYRAFQPCRRSHGALP